MEIIRAKELRSAIIEMLYIRYGEDIRISYLKSLLRYKPHSNESNILKAIKYLSGVKKEYVEIIVDDNNYENSLVSLTPAGINLAEGDITDMGVVIDE